MSELTPEEKKRIYEEEKARMEAQEKVKKESEAKKQKAEAKKKKEGCIGFLGFLVFIVVILWILGVFKTEEKPQAPSKPLYVDLNASVRFTGTQFIITNNDSFGWKNVELEINPGILKSGYKLKTELMSAGQTYTVGALQFAKGDGTRFDPRLIKPQSISIFCDTSKGKGYYKGKWK